MKTQKGFTLVELVVTLGVFSVICTTIFVIAHFAIKFW